MLPARQLPATPGTQVSAVPANPLKQSLGVGLELEVGLEVGVQVGVDLGTGVMVGVASRSEAGKEV